MSAKPVTQKRLSRRGFLIVLGAGAAGLYLGVRLATPSIRLALARWIESSGGPPSRLEAAPTAWFHVTPENAIRLYLPKSEMGQGIHTALAQIAAEELEVDWQQLEVLHASTGQGLDDPVATSASTSVSSLYQPLREAAATLRELLRAEAARQMGIPLADAVAAGGLVVHKDDFTRQRTYGQLFQYAAGWELPKEPPALKPKSELRYIGTPQPRVDLPAKITGQAVYGLDVRLPGMLYGAVARPRTIEGRLKSAAPGEAASQPGVVKVVIEKDFAGVVAESRWQAYQALEKLELEWETGKAWQQGEIEALVTVGSGEGVTIQKDGNLGNVLKNVQPIEGEYRTPLAYHAHLEPLAAVADVQPDEVKVWASTQAAVRLRGKIADALGRDEKTIVVAPVYLGGGFGRKVDETVAVDAARLSQAAGRPVQVGLNRAEDFRNGFVRPPTHHRLSGVLDDTGKITALEHRQASGEVAFPFLPDFLGVVMGADFGSWRGALIYYDIPNLQTTTWLAKLPMNTGWWRGLGLLPNIFAVESFMDELAYAARADPLEFRLRHLGADEAGVRLSKVLRAAAARAGWGEALPPGRGRGVACCYDARTVVAQIAEVSVENGQIRVHKVTAAIDPGLIINPDGVTAQVEGAINMGLSSTLIEEAIVEDGVLRAANFDRYPLLRNAEAPEIEVVLLESGEKPYGIGEPPIGPIAAAVANAVFSISGQRLRRLPLRLA